MEKFGPRSKIFKARNKIFGHRSIYFVLKKDNGFKLSRQIFVVTEPYSVTHCVGKVNYEIEMPDNGGRKQVFHLNYLRKFHWERGRDLNAVIEEAEDIEHYQWNEDQQLHFGEQLTTDQKEMIEEVQKLFPKVTKRTPGKTHKISL